MTVKESVARRIAGDPMAWIDGITNWDLETAHPDHPLTGLRKLRYLRADYMAYMALDPLLHETFLPQVYQIRGNRYVFHPAFYHWLADVYLPSLTKGQNIARDNENAFSDKNTPTIVVNSEEMGSQNVGAKEKVCVICGETFIPRREWHHYCSNSCRKQAWLRG